MNRPKADPMEAGGTIPKLGVSPTSPEVPRTFREGGAQPLLGRCGCQGSDRDYFLRADARALPCPPCTGAHVVTGPVVPEKISDRPFGDAAPLRGRIVLDSHGGGCPSHTLLMRRLRRSTAGCQATDRSHRSCCVLPVCDYSDAQIEVGTMIAVDCPRFPPASSSL